MVTAGLVERVAKLAFDTHCQADRVKTAYEGQLAAIAHAFDERRARELDSLQKGTYALTAAAVIFGIGTIADTTIQLKDEGYLGGTAFGASVGFAEAATAGTWAITVILSCVLGSIWYRQRRTILGTRRFRLLYNRGRHALNGKHSGQPDLWSWLEDTSTDSLEYAAGQDPKFVDSKRWRDRDKSLTARFCNIWDTAAKLVPKGVQRGQRDLRSLSGMLERWAVHSLVLTERVRRIYLYPLPNLTCLYRCGTKIRNSFITELYTPEINAVAKIDFERSMARLGFTSDEAGKIDRWLTEKTYETAAAAAERIAQLGLSVGMSDQDRIRTMETVAHHNLGQGTDQDRDGKPSTASTAIATNSAVR
jgi:hypothetical protein